MIGEKFAVYVTDGVVERVIVDTELSIGYDYDKYYSHDYSYFTNMEDQEYEAGDNWKYGGIAEIGGRWTGVPDERVTAYFSKASNILYTSYDTACETAYFAVEPCLDKGDMLFIIDSYYMSKFYDPSQKAGVALTSEGVDLADLAADAPPLANSSRATCTPSRRSTRRTPRLKCGTERTATASSWTRTSRLLGPQRPSSKRPTRRAAGSRLAALWASSSSRPPPRATTTSWRRAPTAASAT